MQPFGTLPDGRAVRFATLTNRRGHTARISDFGGTLLSLHLGDRQGRPGDVILGHDALAGYLDPASNPYLGCLVGRFANRIGNARFTLDGRVFGLPANNGAHHLHGGVRGFCRDLWTMQADDRADGPGLRLTYDSPDGHEGYPGRVQAEAALTWTHDDVLRVVFTAVTDAPTPVNLTHHAYFNLAGGGLIDGHHAIIDGDRVVSVNDMLIPTGELKAVDGTGLDLRGAGAVLGERFRSGDPAITAAAGIDHCYVVPGMGRFRRMARVSDPASGRWVEAWSDAPGVQMYTGNMLTGFAGKGGVPYLRHSGFCLEPQHLPDSPNQAAFPTPILRPGQTYRHHLEYRFGAG
jgi:aldose 1-epimerase